MTTLGMMKKKSNEPTKTKSNMKKTMRFLSMAALALVGAMMTGCSSEDNFADIQQPENKNNVVTLTTTVGLDDGGATTRALAADGKKTFAAGETMALVYKNTSGSTVKVVSTALTDDDIASGGKSATFTFELTDPDKTKDVTYIYPVAMVNNYGNVSYSGLYNNQDGTLATLASNFDFCTKSGAWDGDNLPTLTLENQLAILAVTLKNEDGASEITGSTTKLTVRAGSWTYKVNRSVAEGPIYVAIRPTTSANISIEATSGSQGYYKKLTNKTYAANNGYSVSWRMTPATLLSTMASDYTAQNGETLYGKLDKNVKISIADGAKVTLKDVDINGSYYWSSGDHAGITCAGDATITLEGTNTVRGFYQDYPGIYVPWGKTLTIEGEGSLQASSYIDGRAPGIGGGYYMHCGDIVINGGNITAIGYGSKSAGLGGGQGEAGNVTRCGKITINGGTVSAQCYGSSGAGIGSGYYGSCGPITINGGTVSASGGSSAAGLGSGEHGSCGTITISGGIVMCTGGNYAAGIGGGQNNHDGGTITIKSTVSLVIASKGSSAPNSIGAGYGGTVIPVSIEAGANVTQN